MLFMLFCAASVTEVFFAHDSLQDPAFVDPMVIMRYKQQLL